MPTVEDFGARTMNKRRERIAALLSLVIYIRKPYQSLEKKLVKPLRDSLALNNFISESSICHKI